VGPSKSRTQVTQETEQKSLTTSIDNTIQPNAITQVGKLQTEDHINSDLAPEKKRIRIKSTRRIRSKNKRYYVTEKSDTTQIMYKEKCNSKRNNKTPTERLTKARIGIRFSSLLSCLTPYGRTQ